ncbi:MAG: molecular chaperone TorD family protein [Myxococcus sp.]|nr:molecular chaperone TorD family protein [Myxococcus sp.]
MEPRARARLYTFFSRLFVRELDDAFVEVLRGELGAALLPTFSASAELDLLSPAARRQATFDVDFAHLTMVNVVPYESFYRRDDAMIESGGANPLATFLTKYGFEADLAAARSLSPDHLGIELELMAVLCAREADADAPALAAQVRRVELELLSEHLLSWAPVYLLAVRRNARTGLYAEAADALLHLLHQHHEALAE